MYRTVLLLPVYYYYHYGTKLPMYKPSIIIIIIINVPYELC